MVAGTDFLDNSSANAALVKLSAASGTASYPGVGTRFEPLGRADPSGLQQEPDQRAADRLVQPDAGRYQRGSGQQPGAVDPPVDRGIRAGAGEPKPAERSSAPPLKTAQLRNI